MLIFSALIALFLVGLFLFSLNVIKNKNQHIAAVLTTLEKKQKEKENILNISQEVEGIKKTKEIITSYFVNPNKIDTFVSYLEDIGLSSGSKIIVKDINISKKIGSKISIKLSILGTFNQVSNTINFLENIPYEVDINQMYLNKDINQAVASDLNVNNTIVPTWQAEVSFDVLSLN